MSLFFGNRVAIGGAIVIILLAWMPCLFYEQKDPFIILIAIIAVVIATKYLFQFILDRTIRKPRKIRGF